MTVAPRLTLLGPGGRGPQLATAAYLVGRRNDCVQAMQRAYQGHLDAGDTLAAVRCAFWLAMVLLTSGEMAVGGGWVARSQRLLKDVSEDVVERGYVLIHLMFRHIFQAEFPRRTSMRWRSPLTVSGSETLTFSRWACLPRAG
jgi:hypothetical protein